MIAEESCSKGGVLRCYLRNVRAHGASETENGEREPEDGAEDSRARVEKRPVCNNASISSVLACPILPTCG